MKIVVNVVWHCDNPLIDILIDADDDSDYYDDDVDVDDENDNYELIRHYESNCLTVNNMEMVSDWLMSVW